MWQMWKFPSQGQKQGVVYLQGKRTTLPASVGRNAGTATTGKTSILPGKAGDDPPAIPAGAVAPCPTAETGKTTAGEEGETATPGMLDTTQVGPQATTEEDASPHTKVITARTASPSAQVLIKNMKAT